jgi:hypothetical protein
MRVARALLRRSLVQWGLLAAALAISAVGSGTFVALLAVPASGIDRGVAVLFADAEPTSAALRVETALAADPAAQDAQVRAALATAIGDASLEVVRAVRSSPVAAELGGGRPQLVLGTQERIEALAELVDGDWARSGDEVTLGEPAAAALGAGVGDTIVLPSGPHVVAGVWRAHDPADAAWFSETLVASGRLGDAVGPVLVADAGLAGLEVRPRVSWTLVPHGIDAASLAALAPVEGRLRAATSDLASGTSYAVTVSGGLADTLARAQGAVTSARALSGTAVVLALVTAGIVLALVARSLGQVRQTEWELLTARGLSRGHAAALGLVEAAVVVGLGTAIGAGAAVPIAGAADAVVPPGDLAAVAVVGLVGVVLVAVAVRATAPASVRAVAETDSIVPALGVTALAAFVLVTADTVPSSPVRYLAPSLALVAGVLLLRLLLAPGMRLAERVAARGTALLPVLPLRQLGRRPRAVASAFVVVALAAGAVVVAGLTGSAVERDHDAQLSSIVGGEVRIRFTGVDHDPVTAAPYAQLDGVSAATEVALVAAQAGSLGAQLIVADEDAGAVTGVEPPAADDGVLRVRVAPALATRLGVGVGDEVPLAVPGVRAKLVTEVAEIGAVPGAGGTGMLVSRAALASQLPADAPALVVDEVWLATARPEAIAERVRAVSARPVTVLTDAGASTLPVTEAGVVAITASACLVVLMGLGGLVASSASLRRLRRSEVVPLRALGVGASAQARARVVELVLTALAGVVAGAAAGALAAWFATGAAATWGDPASATPLALGGGLVAGVLVIAVAAGLAVRRDAEVRS